MVNGGLWQDSETSLLPLIAMLSQHYNRPFYEIINYLKDVGSKYGSEAVQLEIDFVSGLRRATAEKYNTKK